jgi:type IV secretion system protein VirB9
MIRKIFLQTIVIIVLIAQNSYALRESRPTSMDSRIRVLSYSPDDVFKYVGYYGYQASIELGKDEVVSSISMGDTTSWQIVPSGNRIFIKPMEPDATTNMTLITNKRTYFFELYAEEAADIRDPDMVFNVKFLYPDEEGSSGNITNYNTNSYPIDFDHPEKYNFNYSLSGDDEIAPIKIFDDGEFMYLQFRDKNKEIPAIFAVDENRKESMINYHMNSSIPNMVVIEHVFKKLAIRVDDKITCIFNEEHEEYEDD